MDWHLAPALLAAACMALFGLGALVRPSALGMVGVAADSPLGISELRSVFGAMFIALGVACIFTREPIVFAVVGAAWIADAAVRVVAVVIDRVPLKQAVVVLAVACIIGGGLLSGYWLA